MTLPNAISNDTPNPASAGTPQAPVTPVTPVQPSVPGDPLDLTYAAAMARIKDPPAEDSSAAPPQSPPPTPAAPAAETPAPGTPAPETPATPPAPPAADKPAGEEQPAENPMNTPLGKAMQKMQREFAALKQDLGQVADIKSSIDEIKAQLLKPTGNAADDAANRQQAQQIQQQQDELEAMLAEGYEVDIAQDPLKVARAVKKLRDEIVQGRNSAAAERQAAEQQRQQAEYQALQARHPDVDLADLWREEVMAADAEGFGQLGEKALTLRSQQRFNARLAALTPAAAPAVPAPKPGTPAPKPPVKTGGAGNLPGGAGAASTIVNPPINPLPSRPSDLDSVYAKHSQLVKG